MIRLDLKPLSVNRAWQGRRYKTPEYASWSDSAAWILKANRLETLEGPVSLTVRWFMKTAEMSDIDNPLKVLLDAIVRAGLIKDDRQIFKLTVEKKKSDTDYIEIELVKIETH